MNPTFEYGYIDLGQVLLYLFWLFFIGLIIYLRREDRRIGYPLKTEGAQRPTMIIPVPPEKRARAKHPALAASKDAPAPVAASAAVEAPAAPTDTTEEA